MQTLGCELKFPEHTLCPEPGAVVCVCNVSVLMVRWAVEGRLGEWASLEQAGLNDEEETLQ